MAYYAPTNGQIEIVNQHIAMQLRPFMNHFQDNWLSLLPILDHAAAILPYKLTGVSLFLVSCGYEPRMLFNWRTILRAPTMEKLNYKAAVKRVKQMEEVWVFVKRKIQ
jgi:hypothetical protein